jgi:cytosine deaminase
MPARKGRRILTTEAARRRRTLISQVLVAGLIAVAYSEPVTPVTTAFDQHGVNISTLAWVLVYVATVLRFFVGDILHLEKADLVAPEAEVRWFWDMSFIVAQCIVLIFAGALTTVYVSASAEVSFVDYLLILYSLDVVWIVSVHVTHRVGSSTRFRGLFRRMVRDGEMPPIGWAIMNVGLGALMWRLGLITGKSKSVPCDWKLYTIVGANAVAFVGDVFFLGYGMRDGDANVPSKPNTGRANGMSDYGMEAAMSEANVSRSEGGIPIGAALLTDDGSVLSVGHNRRVQQSSPILHAELDCLANAGLRGDYTDVTLYSTLMPCKMCAGAAIQFGIRRIVVGESRNFRGAGELLRGAGIEVIDLDEAACRQLLSTFIAEHPEVWREDIGAGL